MPRGWLWVCCFHAVPTVLTKTDRYILGGFGSGIRRVLRAAQQAPKGIPGSTLRNSLVKERNVRIDASRTSNRHKKKGAPYSFSRERHRHHFFLLSD